MRTFLRNGGVVYLMLGIGYCYFYLQMTEPRIPPKLSLEERVPHYDKISRGTVEVQNLISRSLEVEQTPEQFDEAIVELEKSLEALRNWRAEEWGTWPPGKATGRGPIR